MKEQTSTGSSCGGGFCGLLTLVFITLKLTGFITWSWLWVLAPIWITISLVLVILTLGLLVGIFLERYR